MQRDMDARPSDHGLAAREPRSIPDEPGRGHGVAWEALPPSLRPTPRVQAWLAQAWEALERGDPAQAQGLLEEAVEQARGVHDRAGLARALAQLASLEEGEGRLEAAEAHNRAAAALFLELDDGAGLIQTCRVEAFIHLRRGELIPGVTALARALALALQMDPAPVFITLQQVVRVAGHLVHQGHVEDLLPLAAAIQEAVARVEAENEGDLGPLADVAELARTVAGTLASLGVMAQEPDLSPDRRRALAARATHQAWMVDAWTRGRWGLAGLVEEALQAHLDFHEPLV